MLSFGSCSRIESWFKLASKEIYDHGIWSFISQGLSWWPLTLQLSIPSFYPAEAARKVDEGRRRREERRTEDGGGRKWGKDQGKILPLQRSDGPKPVYDIFEPKSTASKQHSILFACLFAMALDSLPFIGSQNHEPPWNNHFQSRNLGHPRVVCSFSKGKMI